MAPPEVTILGRYRYGVIRIYHQPLQNRNGQQQQRPNLLPTDWFNFCIHVFSHSTYLNSITRLLYCPFQYIGCKSFFQEGQAFLRTNLAHLYFPPESLDQIIEGVISKVRGLFELDESFATDPDPGVGNLSESQGQEFPLFLMIFVDEPIPADDDSEFAVMEESMQEVRMIPASNEAIKSLKKIKVTDQKQCNICMEDFDVGSDDDGAVEVSPMPCGHVFHQQCIVRWLQTSHMCPLCRYPMPTASN